MVLFIAAVLRKSEFFLERDKGGSKIVISIYPRGSRGKPRPRSAMMLR